MKVSSSFNLFIFVFPFLIGVIGCGGNGNVKAPDKLKDTIPVEILPSQFNLNISYGVKDLQEFLNEKFEGEFLRTNIYPIKKQKTDVLVILSKHKNIQLNTKGQELECTFPLHVHADVVDSRLIMATKIKPVDAEMIITLQTPVALESNWHLITKFTLTKVKWEKRARIQVTKNRSVDLSKKIEDYLEDNKEEITAMLDKEINKSVSLEKPIGKIWTDLQKPIVIHKKEPKTYVKFICEDIAGKFSLNENSILCDAAINARIAILTDTAAENTVKPLPPYKKNNQISEYSDINLYAFVDFEEITGQVEALLEKKPIVVSGQSVTIKKVEVYGSKLGLTVLLQTTGDIRGKLIATGTPAFDSLHQTISLKDFEFQLASEHSLINAGEQLLHDVIRDTLRAALTVGMSDLIKKVPEIIEKAIAKGKTGKAISADLEKFKVHNCQIVLDGHRIHIKVHATFVGSIRLKHLNPGKEIQISPGKKKAASS